MDTNNDGILDKTEVQKSMLDSGVEFSEEEFNEYFNSIDIDKDGKLSLEELINKFMNDNKEENN